MSEHGSEDRVALAGVFWERGVPLTDEVWATREYLRRKAKREDKNHDAELTTAQEPDATAGE